MNIYIKFDPNTQDIELFLTKLELAKAVQCSVDTIDRRFKASNSGKINGFTVYYKVLDQAEGHRRKGNEANFRKRVSG